MHDDSAKCQSAISLPPTGQMDIRAVIFDCDGVMFDTTRANTAYYNHILRHFGRPSMTADQIAYTQMHTVQASIAHLFKDNASLAQAAVAFRDRMSYVPFLDQMQMEPELIPLLKRLRPAYKTAVATNRTDTMGRVMRVFGLDVYFDAVVCAMDVQRPKPYPDLLQAVLDRFGLHPGQAVYIGDSLLDEQAAKAAGTYFVAYGNRSLAADDHIRRLGQIDRFLQAGKPLRSKAV